MRGGLTEGPSPDCQITEETLEDGASDVDDHEKSISIPAIIQSLEEHENEMKRLKLEYAKMEKKHASLLDVLNDKE